MECPKCGKKMKHDLKNYFCIFCGYLDNGNMVQKETEEIPASDLEIYLGKEYDKFYRNQNTVTIFFLGPFYFCYLRFFWLGFFLLPLNLLFYIFWLALFPTFPLITLPVAFFILRIFYMTLSNTIFLKLTEQRLERKKKRSGARYQEELHHHKLPITSGLQPIIAPLLWVLIFFFITQIIVSIST